MALGLEPGMTVPPILRLKIDRFRGLKAIKGEMPRGGTNRVMIAVASIPAPCPRLWSAMKRQCMEA